MDINFLTSVLLIMIASETSFLVYQNIKKQKLLSNEKLIFVDTSVLIDGRIITVARSGFITGRLCIPRSVVGELQLMADKADGEKRSRARHGLDVINELKSIEDLNFEIFQDGSHAEEGVDERLLSLAKKYNGSVCTIDFNLNKVARIEGIQVLNVNDLSMGLRMAYLPGEKMTLELTQKGNDQHQAVGHLPDGTMVVVERADKLIGKSAEVEFTRSLQTSAGKMMFAKLISKNDSDKNNYKKNSSKNNSKAYSMKSKLGRRNKSSAEDNFVELANKR